MTKRTYLFILLMVLSAAAQSVYAEEVIVIVHPSNSLSAIHISELKRIYLGKKKYFPNGGKVIPADLPNNNATRKTFYEVVVGMSGRRLKSYWSKRIFTGKATPPKQLPDTNAMIEWVSKQPKAVGYLYKSAVNDSVKVLNLK